MSKHQFIALLPMKAHSERIPGKNFKDFKGKPLFEWILDALLNVPEIEKVIINTDGVDILKQFDITSHEKVLLRDRDQHICGDFVSMNKVIENDIEFAGDRHFIMTHTTNPLISSNTISKFIATYEKSISEGFDSLFSVNRFQSRFYDSDVQPVNHDPENLIRTQDLDPLYEENSCLYLFSRSSFQTTKARIGKSPKLKETPSIESVDIDDQDTWNKAEINFTIINSDEV